VENWPGIFEIQSEEEFLEWSLRIFRFQYANTLVYREFCDYIKVSTPQSLEEIPFLPISFFKTHRILHKEKQAQFLFKSSGTTGMVRSVHPVAHPEIYEESFLRTYEDQIGPLKEQVILALLPSYLEQGESSLVYMVDRLVKETQSELSGFVLHELKEVKLRYEAALSSGKKVVIFGVSYALLDLAEQGIDLSQAVILETGGMKGRRKELTKKELHEVLKSGLGVSFIASEYGMTELFSQAYALSDGVFQFPKWMKATLVEVNDPLSPLTKEKTGAINIIDLANVYSCSFIATQDLGRISPKGLELMGRFDFADTRGCNLMVQ
jgi:phenylacetate-coenzyme A ligase PaaK-like adenylate-forming protein